MGEARVDDLARLVSEEEYVAAFALAVERATDRLEAEGRRSPSTLDALERLAEIAFHAGVYDAAEEVLDRVLQARRAAPGTTGTDLSRALTLRGLALRLTGDRLGSKADIEEALRLLARLPSAEREPLADAIQAEANWTRYQDLDRAIELYRLALETRLEDPLAPVLKTADTLVWLGWSLHHAGRHQQAEAPLARAVELLTAAGWQRHSLMGVIGNIRASRSLLRGEWEAAAAELETSTAIFEDVRRKYPPGAPRLRIPLDGNRSLALAHLMLDRPEEAWRVLQKEQGAINADFLRLSRLRELAPESYDETLAARREAVAARREREQRSGSSSDDDWRLLLRELSAQARVFELEQQYLELYPLAPVELSELQERLGPRQAFVGWELTSVADFHRASAGPAHTVIWAYVIRHDSMRCFPLVSRSGGDGTRTVIRWFWSYLGGILRAAAWPEPVEADPALEADGLRLGRLFVEPLLGALDGMDELIIQLSELNPTVPLEVVPLESGGSLKDRFAISYVPSAECLRILLDRAGRGDHKGMLPALVIGDPSFQGDAAPQARWAFDHLADLPFSGSEVETIVALLPGADVLRGVAATEAALESLAAVDGLAAYRTVHIATHVVHRQPFGRSALVLSSPDPGGQDGLLHPAEMLAAWRLDAALVVLSGCRSIVGSGQYDKGEYLGFAQTLLAAGAANVLASLWNVDDESTALLMRRFYENMTGRFSDHRRGFSGAMPRARALQEAQLWLRDYVDAEGHRPFQHPVYWSGFFLLGLPSESER